VFINTFYFFKMNHVKTTIQITKSTWKRLMSLRAKVYAEDFNDIIIRMLDIISKFKLAEEMRTTKEIKVKSKVEPELRPKFIKEMKKVEKEKHYGFKDVSDLRKITEEHKLPKRKSLFKRRQGG